MVAYSFPKVNRLFSKLGLIGAMFIGHYGDKVTAKDACDANQQNKGILVMVAYSFPKVNRLFSKLGLVGAMFLLDVMETKK